MVTLTLNVPIKTPAYKQNVYNFLSIKISLAIVIAKGVVGEVRGVCRQTHLQVQRMIHLRDHAGQRTTL